MAAKISVSGTQITKWKQGEKIPKDKMQKLMELAALFDDNVEWVVLMGNNPDNAQDWYDYLEDIYGEMGSISNGLEVWVRIIEVHAPSILLS